VRASVVGLFSPIVGLFSSHARAYTGVPHEGGMRASVAGLFSSYS
jgi:hypothetical protein